MIERILGRLQRGLLVGSTLALALSGCGSGDQTLSQLDPDIVPAEPGWEMVYPIFQRSCIPCHQGTEEDRLAGAVDPDHSFQEAGAPRALGAEPGLESCDAIQEHLDDIFVEIFVENRMPPGAWPRLDSREKLIVQRWINAGAPGPCN